MNACFGRNSALPTAQVYGRLPFHLRRSPVASCNGSFTSTPVSAGMRKQRPFAGSLANAPGRPFAALQVGRIHGAKRLPVAVAGEYPHVT
jgi:hypothetical protein